MATSKTTRMSQVQNKERYNSDGIKSENKTEKKTRKCEINEQNLTKTII